MMNHISFEGIKLLVDLQSLEVVPNEDKAKANKIVSRLLGLMEKDVESMESAQKDAIAAYAEKHARVKVIKN